MRRVFKSIAFQRLIKKSGLTDEAYCKAVLEMERGLIDADLGGGIVKKRVALPGGGKSAGARTLLAPIAEIADSSCTASARMKGPISAPNDWWR